MRLKMFPANDPRVATVVHDVMERDGWEAKADEIEKKFGPVHILVNNAGVGLRGGVVDGTYNDWDWGMGVNFWGPVYGCKTFVPRMRARPSEGCHIVTTTSTSGILVGLPVGIYAVSKIAATGLMEQLRDDLRNTNIGTSTLMPGLTQTNISQSETPPSGSTAQCTRHRPLRRCPAARSCWRRAAGAPASAARGRWSVLGASAGPAHGRPPGGQRHPQQRPVHLPGAGISPGHGGSRLRVHRVDGAVHADAGQPSRPALTRTATCLRRCTPRKWRIDARPASGPFRAFDNNRPRRAQEHRGPFSREI